VDYFSVYKRGKTCIEIEIAYGIEYRLKEKRKAK